VGNSINPSLDAETKGRIRHHPK
jgi:hypothetical protein